MAIQHQLPFNARIVAELSATEIALTQTSCADFRPPGPASRTSGSFVFFAAFDGTNNNKDDLALSETPQQTNAAQLFEQVSSRRASDAGLKTGYFAGVGTGGDRGSFDARSSNPTPYIVATAQAAYEVFAREANGWLETQPLGNPREVSVALTGFSRGAGAAVAFATLVNDRGLVFAGQTLIPPGIVRVTAAVLLDPVYTGIQLDLTLPPNVTGPVLVVRARHEYRYLFRAADYSADARIRTVEIPGNHGNIGGMYDNGIGALVLDGAIRFLDHCGVPVAGLTVASKREFDSSQPVRIYTEGIDRYGNKMWSESGERGASRLTDPVNRARRC